MPPAWPAVRAILTDPTDFVTTNLHVICGRFSRGQEFICDPGAHRARANRCRFFLAFRARCLEDQTLRLSSADDLGDGPFEMSLEIYMNKLLKLALAMTLAPSIGSAAPLLIDSTGVAKTVVSTIVMPAPGLTEKNVKTIIENRDFNGGGSGNSVPPGYTEVAVAMGPRSIGDGGGALGLVYYQGLGYGVAAPAGGQDPCGGNLTSPPRVVGNGAYEYCSGGDSSSCSPVPASYFVCEPVGTRYSLKKDVGGQVLNVSRPMLDLKTLSPAIGMSTQAAGAYCQSVGYANYTPGTVTATQPGDCGQKITRWNGSAFYNDDACYNNVMQSLQCYK